ncbi:MAG TPA: GxxExxY protein [Gemmatimonadales bacterium]|jgi:GxxExxY protein|nr:GxxExxY protein [Gemmatimonadales bacterium]
MATMAVAPPQLDLLTHDVVQAATEVHRCLGPGLLQSAYLECMCHELRLRNVVFDREVPLPLHYKGLAVAQGHRITLLIGGCIVVELKAVEQVLPIHRAQLLACLRLKRLPLGLLINFNVAALRTGIIRLTN